MVASPKWKGVSSEINTKFLHLYCFSHDLNYTRPCLHSYIDQSIELHCKSIYWFFMIVAFFYGLIWVKPNCKLFHQLYQIAFCVAKKFLRAPTNTITQVVQNPSFVRWIQYVKRYKPLQYLLLKDT